MNINIETYLSKVIDKDVSLSTEKLLAYYELFARYLEKIYTNEKPNIKFSANQHSTTFKDEPQYIFVDMFKKLQNKNDHSDKLLIRFTEINNYVYSSKILPLEQRINIFKGIEINFPLLEQHYFKLANIQTFLIFTKVRFNLFFKCLKLIDDEELIPHKTAIFKANHYLSNYIKTFLNKSEFLDCIEFLKENFIEAIGEFKSNILTAIIRVNDLYHIVSKAEVYNLYIENISDVNIDKRQWHEISMWFYPLKTPIIYYDTNNTNYQSINFIGFATHSEIEKFSLGLNINSNDKEPTFLIQEDKIKYTVIDFVINNKIETSKISNDEFDISFLNTDDFRLHPFYAKLPVIYISGSTFGHLLDITPNSNPFTIVKIVIPESYHPEFHFETTNSTNVKGVDFTEEQALYGRIHLPTKIRVIGWLRKLVKEGKIKGDIKLEDTTIDLFSFMRTTFFSQEKKLLFERTYFHTSENRFNYFTHLYHKKLNSMRGFKSDFIDKFDSLTIDTHSNLLGAIQFLFDSVIEHNIRLKSGYKNFWRDISCSKQPKTEPEIQPFLLNQIESLCSIKGIMVVREPASGEGFIDMLFSYTNNRGRLLKVCVEIKKAHHSDVETSINTQFKRYLDSQQTTFGLYVVIWFKYQTDEIFNLPTKFEKTEDLEIRLKDEIPEDYNIGIKILDVTKPISPSKL